MTDTANITAKTVQWASSHDWYVSSRTNSDGHVTITVRDEEDWSFFVTFTNRDELRAYAGY